MDFHFFCHQTYWILLIYYLDIENTTCMFELDFCIIKKCKMPEMAICGFMALEQIYMA